MENNFSLVLWMEQQHVFTNGAGECVYLQPHLQPHRDSCGAAADTSPSAPKGATIVQQ